MQKNRGIVAVIVLFFIAIFIFLFAVGYFTSARPFGLSNYKEALNLKCGLTITNPKENSIVAFPYKISGYAGGCGWDPVNKGDVGTVDILGPNGLVITKAKLFTNDPVGDSPYYFEATVDVPVSFIQDSGVLLFRNMQFGLERKEVKIPVRFSSHL